jgi:hypothetical protein
LSGPDNAHIQRKAELAGVFGSEAMLPGLMEIYKNRLHWRASDDGPYIAYFLRYTPKTGVQELEALGDEAQFAYIPIEYVFRTRHVPFPEALLALLRIDLESDNMSTMTAVEAADRLSNFGLASDKARIEARLDEFHKQWAGGDGMMDAPNATHDRKVAALSEVGLVRALLDGKVWKLTPEEKTKLKAECLSQACVVLFK